MAPSRAAHRRRQRHLVAGVLALVLLPVLCGPLAEAASAQAATPTPDQARQRREDIKRQQADIAANLQPLTATDEDLNRAVQAVGAQVRAQEAKVNDAQRAADEAQRNADHLAAQQADLQKQVDALKVKVRDRAVSAYVNPDAKVQQEQVLFSTDDLTEAERKRELVESVTGRNDDAVDQMRSLRQSLEETRVEQQSAAEDARQRKANLDGELQGLKDSQAQQAKVKAMVDSRIAGYKSESAQLAGEDANMQKIIEDAQRRYAEQLAAAQRAQEAAAQQAAAQQAAAAKASSAGGGGGAPAAAPAAAPVLAAPGGGFSNGSCHWPVALHVSQEFGQNGHPGIDLVATLGTPVAAARGGVVISAGWNNGGYGNLILIDNGPYVTAYAHLSAINVSAGTFVQGGQIIGAVGSTGNSTGPHLHFEVRVNGSVQNPRNYCS